jgi:hypothetical protein
MKPSHKIFVAGTAALLVSFFAWEWYLSPQARVERLLHRAADAAEQRDTDRLLSCFSKDYSDFRNSDYSSLAAAVERGFQQVDRLNVTVEDVRSEVSGDEAATTFGLTIVAVRGQERYLLVGQPMQPEKLQVELKKESGEWRILKAARHQVEEPGSPE